MAYIEKTIEKIYQKSCDINDLKQIFDMSTRNLYYLVQKDDFPKPLPYITPKRWSKEKILKFIRSNENVKIKECAHAVLK